MYWTCAGKGGVSWRALRRVEGGDAATGTGTDIDQPATVAEGAGDSIDDDGDLGQRFLDSARDFSIFVINNARNLKGRLGVESFGCDISGFRREIVEFCCASVDGFQCGGLLKHGKGCHKYPTLVLNPFYSYSL